MTSEQIADAIYDWIAITYGSQEMESPFYDIISLAKYLERRWKQ